MNGITNYVWKCDGDGGQRRAEEEQTPGEDEEMGGDASREKRENLKRTAI